MSLVLGLDVASVDGNKPIDWVSAKKAGARFVVIRGTYSTWADPLYTKEAQRARDAGLIVGSYLFPLLGVTSPTPKEQVEKFAASVKLVRSKDFAPCLDVEFPGGIKKTGRTRAELLQLVYDFAALLDTVYKCKPILYTSARVWDGTDEDSLAASGSAKTLIDSPLWLARYPYKTRIEAQGDGEDEKLNVAKLAQPPVPVAWGENNVWIHQYQGDALQFPGFSATTDLNRFFAVGFGSSGEKVRWLQRRLGMVQTGFFDSATLGCVRDFQSRSSLQADGVVGPMTFAALSWCR